MENDSSKCVQMMNRYLELDKNEKVPFGITMHILFCRKCHNQIKMLVAAEKACSAPLKLQTPVTDSSISAVMQKVAPETYRKFHDEPISITNWIISGVIMLALLFVPAVCTNVINNREFSIAYAILIAVCATVYCSVFVIGNIDFFIKKISTGISLSL